jgi:hypothetical protein
MGDGVPQSNGDYMPKKMEISLVEPSLTYKERYFLEKW